MNKNVKETNIEPHERISELEDALREILASNRLENAKEIAAYAMDVDLSDYLVNDEEEDYQYDIDDYDELDNLNELQKDFQERL